MLLRILGFASDTFSLGIDIDPKVFNGCLVESGHHYLMCSADREAIAEYWLSHLGHDLEVEEFCFFPFVFFWVFSSLERFFGSCLGFLEVFRPLGFYFGNGLMEVISVYEFELTTSNLKSILFMSSGSRLWREDFTVYTS